MTIGEALLTGQSRLARRRRAALPPWDALRPVEKLRVNLYRLLAVLVVAFLAVVGLAAGLGLQTG
jgi:hypothetical protein